MATAMRSRKWNEKRIEFENGKKKKKKKKKKVIVTGNYGFSFHFISFFLVFTLWWTV